ncbi:MAG: NUDIX domain-containing protein [Actinomycetota bacterium]|nr:NUDIX domain-containing protein [Actinomycetota bacterium]
MSPVWWESSEVERYVVGAVIACDGRALLLRRKPDDFLGDLWELPSGRVEGEETLEQTLEREIAEETGLRVTSIERPLGTFDYRSGSGKATRQVTFEVRVEPGQVELSEHNEHAWLGVDELEGLYMSDETREVLASALRGGV